MITKTDCEVEILTANTLQVTRTICHRACQPDGSCSPYENDCAPDCNPGECSPSEGCNPEYCCNPNESDGGD